MDLAIRGNLKLLYVMPVNSNKLRNGWGASAVDALSTALVMQIPEIVDTILEFIPTINFDKTDTEVSLFETTIRYIGGMLSGKFKSLIQDTRSDFVQAMIFSRARSPSLARTPSK